MVPCEHPPTSPSRQTRKKNGANFAFAPWLPGEGAAVTVSHRRGGIGGYVASVATPHDRLVTCGRHIGDGPNPLKLMHTDALAPLTAHALLKTSCSHHN
jgi:hypothetical protein